MGQNNNQSTPFRCEVGKLQQRAQTIFGSTSRERCHMIVRLFVSLIKKKIFELNKGLYFYTKNQLLN